ncbi:hypothetical protein PSECIP111951_02032 [Pseudoalteromonas holothuriae]|uniref:Uncharacterized protein n=1 Tax=Pseudoalteromonas holothuriae TaxID=2963714 RepID=A0ABN8UNT6_9GAMM|nr:hypothetical protein [Pseudoalteromonas sp. CIP111951]CAH9059231.1 hypothetical protein PSECIP111951_02032 [Pseudoalteromonas sp. CIP111951]
MKALIPLAVYLFSMYIVTAQAAMPQSQILLASEVDDSIKVVSITSDDNYHNQPVVTKKGVYFTQGVTTKEQAQTDLFFYDFADKTSHNLTNTPVSEFSPTLYPDGDGLSSVVVEPDGKQKLWFYPFDKTQSAQRIFEHIEPVGYHAWGNKGDLVMFILGQPHTLQYADLTGHLPTKVAKDIGRTLAFNNKKQIYSFTYDKNGQHWFASFSANTQQVSDHFVMPEGVQDYTWLNESHVAYAIGNRIYMRDFENPKAISQWHNLSPYCDTHISRLSYHQGNLAFVCDKS